MAHTVRIYSGLLSRRLASRYVFQGNSYPRFMRHWLPDQYSQKRRPGTRQSFVKKSMIQNNKNAVAHSHSWVIRNEQESVWLLVNKLSNSQTHEYTAGPSVTPPFLVLSLFNDMCRCWHWRYRCGKKEVYSWALLPHWWKHECNLARNRLFW